MKTRILIVDDHRMVLEGFKLRLEQEANFQVVGAVSNVKDAVAAIASLKPDVVLMDINLPDMNGIEATKRIRLKDATLKIVLLTGDVLPSAAEDALLAGASGFLRKEDVSDDLVKAINVVVSGKTYLSSDAATAIATAIRQHAAEPSELTSRELEVLKHYSAGLSIKQIAVQMNLSVKTVETYRSRLGKKLNAPSRAELMQRAVRLGLAKP